MTTSFPRPAPDALSDKRFWWQHLTFYHWFVVIVASMAWFFDCLDQRIFTLARIPALTTLMPRALGADVQAFGKWVTAYFLIGWGIGGLLFGALGDRFGRTRMLTVTILIYSCFTGLSFFSRTRWDFSLFRFLTGLGVGGVFGLAVALVAETVPSQSRTQALGLLQVLSAVGNISSSFVKIGVDNLGKHHYLAREPWRYLFLVGALPALMVIFSAAFLREPEPWLKLKQQGLLSAGGIFTSYKKLLHERRWHRNLIVGALIASTGVVGLWAIGEYAPDLQRNLFVTHYTDDACSREFATNVELRHWFIVNTSDSNEPGYVAGLKRFVEVENRIPANATRLTYHLDDAVKVATAETEKAVGVLLATKAQMQQSVDSTINYVFLLNQAGAVLGMWLFTRMALSWGRKPAFAVGFASALVITALVYWKMETPRDAYWMMFLMGIAQLSVFAGFSIYLPELFPSELRSTGTSFCYNLGRFAAAGGSFISGVLSQIVFANPKNPTSPLPLRYSAMCMCAIFLIGLATLPFAPETKDQPLP